MIKDKNISNSSLKVLSIYEKLLNSYCSKEELLNDFSDDSLLIYLSTLTNAGIKISKKSSGYYIEDNINLLNFDKNDIKILGKIKNATDIKTNVDFILNYNNLLDKLCDFTTNSIKEKIKSIISNAPFGIKLHPIIYELQNHIKNKNTIIIEYNSPRTGIETFRVLPLYLKIENSKLYLWSKDTSISEQRCLKVERIISINTSDKDIITPPIEHYAICKFNSSEDLKQFNEKNYKIIERKNNTLSVKINYYNKFTFLQKILGLGNNCKLLEPAILKQEISEIINSMRKLYE